MTKEEAQAVVKQHGSIRAAVRSGESRKAIERAMRGDVKPQTKTNGKSVEEFRSLYDKDYIVPKRIKAALEELGDGWDYEVQFAKNAGVSLSDIATYRDMFSAHVISLKETRRVWAGKAKTATILRTML